jgi:DNA-binding PadR family transcriptional regulator
MTVLLLLAEEPMHPYGLRQRIQDWGKDQVVNVTQRNAIYQTIDRLERDGLIIARGTSRQERRPERTVYSATEEGVALARKWVLRMLATPARVYPEFPAALAFLPAVPRQEALAALRRRTAALQQAIDDLAKEVDSRVAEVPGGVDRIYLIEVDYLLVMWRAELAWVRGLIAELVEGEDR